MLILMFVLIIEQGDTKLQIYKALGTHHSSQFHKVISVKCARYGGRFW